MEGLYQQLIELCFSQMILKGMDWRSFAEQRWMKVILLVILVIGLLISGLRTWEVIPLYPQDLISYTGGYYAYSDGGDPYDIESVRQSLSKRAINAAPYNYVYSPPFLTVFLPLDFMNYNQFRSVWIIVSLLSAYIAIWLLALRLKSVYSLFFALLGTLFFTIAATLHDSLVWGQVTPVMLLALSIVVYKKYKGVLAGIVSTVFPLIKIGFFPLALFVKGKRAVFTLVVMLLVLLIIGAAIFGLKSYENWFDSIRSIEGNLGVGIKNNLSIDRGVAIITGAMIYKVDEQRAALEHEYRLTMSEKSGNAIRILYLITVFLITLLSLIKLAARKLKGRIPGKDILLSVVILYLLVVIPFVWLHYGLFMIFPLWTLIKRRNIKASIFYFVSAMLWGMPICIPGVIGSLDWLRFLIPLFWLGYFLCVQEQSPVLISGSKDTQKQGEMNFN